MKTVLASVLLIGALGIPGKSAFATVDVDSEDFFLEAELERCCSETDKKWKGHVQRMVETVDGRIVRERFVARAAFSTYAFSEANKHLAKQGVILKLSNANGPYAECHLPLKNFDIDLKDWKLVTTAAFSVSFDARMKKGQWIVKKSKKDEFCSINLGQPNAEVGIPEIQAGDLAEVFESDVEVLEGEVRLQDD
jgi:hypothetical protein